MLFVDIAERLLINMVIIKKNGKTIRAKAYVSFHFHDEESKRRINQEIRELKKLLEKQNKHG